MSNDIQKWGSDPKNTDAKNDVLEKITEYKKYIKETKPEGLVILDSSYIGEHTFNIVHINLKIQDSGSLSRYILEDVKASATIKLYKKTERNIGTDSVSLSKIKTSIEKTICENIVSWIQGSTAISWKAWVWNASLWKRRKRTDVVSKDTTVVYDYIFNQNLSFVFKALVNFAYSTSNAGISITLEKVTPSNILPSDLAKTIFVSNIKYYNEYVDNLALKNNLIVDIQSSLFSGENPLTTLESYDNLSSEEIGDKFITDIENGLRKQKTDAQKQDDIKKGEDPNARKAPTIQVNKGSHQASITRKALSESELNKGSNRKDDPYFDKRIGNANKVLNDIYGLRTKLNAPGCIKLYEANGDQGYKEPVTIDCFLLQSVQMALKEKNSVFQSLSGDILVYFFGKNPVSCRFSAVLYNTYNQEWSHDFRNYYDKYLRGSASIGKNIRTVISYENHVIEGFFLEMLMQESATNTNIINIDFTMLVVQDHVIDYISPDPIAKETSVETVSEVSQTSDSRLALVPSGYTVTKPEGITSVTARKDTVIRSTADDLPDNRLKTVGAGAALTIIDDPVKGKDGEIWYLLQGGNYKDGSPISKHNAYIREKDINWNGNNEETMSDKKTFDPEQPDAGMVKSKKDIDTKSRSYEQNTKIVETAKQQSSKLLDFSRPGARLSVKATIIADAPVYSFPSSHAIITETISKGTSCVITFRAVNGYMRISVGGKYKGYVHHDFLQTK